MHTHDKSYTSYMSGGDPDRKTDLHNDICLYLTLPDKVQKLIEISKINLSIAKRTYASKTRLSSLLASSDNDKYKKIIGYIDVSILLFETFLSEDGKYYQYNNTHDFHLAIEVKAFKTSITNIIQQINTYKSYAGYNVMFFLCTGYQLNKLEQKTLADANIQYIYVDPILVKKALEEANK
jgi:hypothetical protein